MRDVSKMLRPTNQEVRHAGDAEFAEPLPTALRYGVQPGLYRVRYQDGRAYFFANGRCAWDCDADYLEQYFRRVTP